MKKFFLIILGVIILSSGVEAQRRRGIGIETPKLPATNPDGKIGRLVLDFGFGFGFGGAGERIYDATDTTAITDTTFSGSTKEFRIGVNAKYPFNLKTTLIGSIEWLSPGITISGSIDKPIENYQHGFSRNCFLINLGVRLHL